MIRTATPSALLLSLVAGSAVAQSPPPVYTVRVDNQTDSGYNHRSEMALRASSTTPDIIVAWQEHAYFGVSQIHYNASVDGKSFRDASTVGRVPFPLDGSNPPQPCYTDYQCADPSIAFTLDGKGYIGCIGANHFDPNNPHIYRYDRLWVAKKNHNSSYASSASPSFAPSGYAFDKPVLAAGPGGSGDFVGAALVMREGFGAYVPNAIPSPPQFNLCTQTIIYPTIIDASTNLPTSHQNAAPNAALILRGGSNNGRWVVGQYWGTDGQPSASYSSDGGQTWLPSVNPLRARKNPAVTSSPFEDIVFSQDFSGFSSLPAIIRHYPHITPDPTHSEWVYMTFSGHSPSASTSTYPNSASNIDIYIAQSTDGGVNFSGEGVQNEGSGFRVVRLTDAQLGDPANAVQFFPNIAVDQWGNLHVLYYVGWWVPPTCDNCGGYWAYKVKVAHIQSLNVGQGAVVDSTVDLTSYAFTLDDPSLAQWTSNYGGRPFLGDYMNAIDVRGCQVIFGYIAPPEDGGPAAVYAGFNLIPNSACVVDPGCYANCDGTTVSPVLNANDFICFLQKYAQEDSYANCDGSTVAPLLNANDFQCFLNRYSVGCS